MDAHEIQLMAQRLLDGKVTLDDFVQRLTAPHKAIGSAAASEPMMASLDHATLDLDRARRCGYPEVVYGEGKSVETLEPIFRTLVGEGIDVLATRISSEKAQGLLKTFPAAHYNQHARTFRIPRPDSRGEQKTSAGRVAIVTAGTSDHGVAEEARETLQWMGVDVTLIADVGVAGPHRLPAHLDKLTSADAVVVIAGMEGALPSIVGGYVACPVIGVPTSVGYGASLGGIAALLAMLNSCAANVAVVNIDAGFKAAYIAGQIASRKTESTRES